MKHLKTSILLIAFIVISPFAKAYSLTVDEFFAKAEEFSNQPYYDEVWDENNDPRKHYLPFADKILEVEEDLDFITWFQGTTLAEFLGDNAVIPYPRIISKDENQLLQQGVKQRAQALSKYLEKRFSNNLKERRSIYNIIPKDILRAIDERNHEIYRRNDNHNYKNISFWYGPDIVRASDGKFYIIEDNAGFVGGFGDIKLASETFVKNAPDFGLKSQNGSQFYDEMLTKYNKIAADNGGIAVMVRYDFDDKNTYDHESLRLTEYFESKGLKILPIIPDATASQQQKTPRDNLEITEEGVFFVAAGSRNKEKVGLVLIEGEFSDYDSYNNTAFKKFVLDIFDDATYANEIKIKKIEEDSSISTSVKEVMLKNIRDENDLIAKVHPEIEVIPQNQILKINKILRQNKAMYLVRKHITEGFPGLLKAYSKGQVFLINGPGFESINDKEFYLYVEDMIRNYLDEEPIIHNIPTLSFAKEGSLNEEIFSKVFAKDEDGFYSRQSQLVIKKVVGRGGDAVWVGPKISTEDFGSLESKIKENPSHYIVQTYFPLSQLQGHIVDLRYITDVSPAPYETIVAPFPWGRGILAEGSNGKVNLSDQGGMTAVFIEEAAVAA